MFEGAVPIDKLSLPCDSVKKINADIARGKHPEDGLLEARVIAHTAMCDSCRVHFREEFLKAKKEKEEAK